MFFDTGQGFVPAGSSTMLVLNEETYARVIQEQVPAAKKFVWILTADVKDLHVESTRGRFRPFLAVLADLVDRGVYLRLVHAKEPGPRFRSDFDKHPALVEGELFERVLCPRMHMKVVIVDGRFAYVGSASLTGAGLGAKSPTRRNFEAGYTTTHVDEIDRLMEFVDALYLGDHCIGCGRRDTCPEPLA